MSASTAGTGQLAHALALLTSMARIRAFETVAQEAMAAGEVPGVIHPSIGQEAIAAGVCANLAPTDYLTSTHRGHGHALAKGADARRMMAELYGRATGTCGGKGGSMHIADFGVGMLGANGVVAGGIPIAVGAAQGVRLLGRDAVVACFFGDGAINRGPFLEGLNWAQIYALPVLFVCENNGFAAFTRTASVTAGPGAAARARSLGIETTEVDGNDVFAVDDAARAAIGALRAGRGPQLLDAQTYRLEGHTSSDPAAYRAAEEVAARWQADPIARACTRLRGASVAPAELDGIVAAAREEMERAREAARSAPWPSADTLFADVQECGAPTWRS